VAFYEGENIEVISEFLKEKWMPPVQYRIASMCSA